MYNNEYVLDIPVPYHVDYLLHTKKNPVVLFHTNLTLTTNTVLQ